MTGFIAGDWGTSHLRLSLCDDAGNAMETITGPGVAGLDRDLGTTFFSLVREWQSGRDPLPAVLCGMAGSTLGWREVPYLACPIHPEKIARGAVCFEEAGRHIAIAPGISCRNRLLGPDVMRGEETQILGALRRNPELAADTQLLCMPGTHSKWVLMRDGVIEHFLTGVTGELFDVLSRHSVLVGKTDSTQSFSRPAFESALEQTKLHPDAELIHLLFEVRSRQLSKELKPRDAASYLSGLVIGQDVAGAVRLFRNELAHVKRTTLIGTPALCELYAAPLEMRGLATKSLDGDAASLAGLAALYQALFHTGLAHAS
jgi:2-dehydro-3-deoxygalactonokinase